MTEEEKKIITQEKNPGRVTQGHKLAAFMKKRREEILRNKEQSTEQSLVQSTEQSSVQSSVQSTFSQMILISMVLVCLLSLPLVFTYFFHIALSLKIKNKPMKKSINHNDFISLKKKLYNK